MKVGVRQPSVAQLRTGRQACKDWTISLARIRFTECPAEQQRNWIAAGENREGELLDELRRRRRDSILKGLDITRMRGVEMGPLNRPLIAKGESEVYYVDHCSAEQLRAKYHGDPNVDPNDIVDVDFIWSNEPAKDLLQDVFPLDYVVASHVIEHVPDLIGWLHEMHDTLREGGSLALAIPDKRFTFDAYRRTSAMEEIRLAYNERRRRPGLRPIMDHFANVVKADTWALWDDYSRLDDFPFFHDPTFLSLAALHYAEGRYVDVHCWVFTPWSFLEVIGHAVKETGLGFNLQTFQTTPYHDLEFYARLVRVTQSTTDWEREAAVARADALWPRPAERLAELAEPQSFHVASRITDLERLRAEVAEATRRAELAEARSAQLASRVAELESSTSWQMTAPIRAIVKALRSGARNRPMLSSQE